MANLDIDEAKRALIVEQDGYRHEGNTSHPITGVKREEQREGDQED